MTSYAQRKASQDYRMRQKQKGITQHLIYADAQRWQILRAVNKALKSIDLDELKGIDVDDEGRYIRFIYHNQAKTRVVLTNQSQDDEG